MLASLDILGPKIKFYVKERNQFKTKFGGILTVIYGFISLFLVYIFGRDIVEKKFPNVTLNKVMDSSMSYNLTFNNFAFALFNQLDSSPVTELERKFFQYLSIFTVKNGTTTEDKIFFEKCSKTHLDRIYRELKTDRNSYYCFPEGKTITLKGIYGQGDYVATRLNVDYCTEKNSNRTDCYNKNRTISTYANLQMHVIFDDIYSDSFNYTDPYSRTFYKAQIITNANTFSRQMIYFKNIQFITDKGWLSEDKYSQINGGIDYAETSLLSSPLTDTIFSHMFVTSRWKEVYNRSYIKLQGIFAYTGALMHVFLVGFKVIVSYTAFPEIHTLFYNNFNFGENVQTIQNKNISSHVFPTEVSSKIILNSQPQKYQKEIKTPNCNKEVKISNIHDRILRGCSFFGNKHKKGIWLNFKKMQSFYIKMFSLNQFAHLCKQLKIIEDFSGSPSKISGIEPEKLKINQRNFDIYNVFKSKMIKESL
jgi:hypothetical protein